MVKNPTNILLALSFLVGLSACSKPSDPRDVLIPADPRTWKENAELVAAGKSLPEDERELSRSWMMRALVDESFFGDKTKSITLGQAIEEQRKFEAERAAKAK